MNNNQPVGKHRAAPNSEDAKPIVFTGICTIAENYDRNGPIGGK